MNTKPHNPRATKKTVAGIALSSVLAITVQFAPITAQADILAIGPNAKVLKKANTPKRGESMGAVSRKFGAAKQVKSSKGVVTKHNPKITQWIYPTFSVYFENSHVIHSVIRR